ncbi:DUF3488 and transglutaminase-like domain-containing protein [Nocardioides aequoreus]|uniref:DUF3488 and transglutaminase-like domain-containing protein n=1 Tax=Nocardioides aequoreus TaxID=397278 RepID=UPI0004C3CE9D|nr:DUF3488 and transglutaminase-like domain-containing protein [Nocardioides aequoreus]
MTGRAAPPVRLTGPLLGLLLATVATAGWGGLVVQPRGFVLPTALAGLLVVLSGVGLRRLRTPAPVTALLQLLVAGLAWHAAFAPATGTLRIPTRASVSGLADEVELGAAALATYLSPVDVMVGGTHALLAGCGLLVVWTVDVLAQTLRQPPLAGLPVLVALSVPATVQLSGLSTAVFVVAAVAYLLLLASDRHDRWRGAGRAEPTVDRAARSPLGGAGGAWPVAASAVVAALVLAPLVPVSDPLRPGGEGEGGGGGGGEVRLTTVNPFVSLRRDLLQQTSTPMVFAATDAVDPGYLRTTVLDVFDDDSWSASPRELPAENSADGTFPAPEGLSVGAGGVVSQWEIELAPRYRTTWLPLPAPVREIDVEGAWRYDATAQDVALAYGEVEPGLRYRATAFSPAVTARQLNGALAAPDDVLEPMTEVPDELPPVIEERAREVTEGAETPYQQAVALQDWFRADGGFRYSLDERPGSGLQLLADFVTDDRVGYCEQFAAAMAAMGRTLGIPSRVAVGFLGPEELDDDQLLFTSDSRHAWTEMYFQGAGWVRFEPTPAARTGESPDYTREALTEPESGPTPTTAPLTPEQQSPDQLPDAAGDQGADDLWPGLPALAAGLLLLLVLVAPTALRRWQRRRRLGGLDAASLTEGTWAELRAVALDHGLTWDDGRSPRAQARELVRQVAAPQDDVERLELLLQQVERRRYARGVEDAVGGGVATLAPPSVDLTATLERWTVLLREHEAAHRPGARTRVWRRLLPASLLSRG